MDYDIAVKTILPGRYRHFKGNEYEVLYIARHSETTEPMVVYRALYGEGGIWVRPAEMWNETVERDGKLFQRFTRIDERIEVRQLTAEYDAAVAELVRTNLKANGLDIPGTVYFDDGLDHLSNYYSHSGRAYYGLLQNKTVVGGIGFAEFDGFDRCCELQKLYLADSVKGRGLGYDLIDYIETRARENGYRQMYLETHDNLQTAIHVYEKAGYKEIPRPESVVHSTMNRFFLKSL